MTSINIVMTHEILCRGWQQKNGYIVHTSHCLRYHLWYLEAAFTGLSQPLFWGRPCALLMWGPKNLNLSDLKSGMTNLGSISYNPKMEEEMAGAYKPAVLFVHSSKLAWVGQNYVLAPAQPSPNLLHSIWHCTVVWLDSGFGFSYQHTIIMSWMIMTTYKYWSLVLSIHAWVEEN